MNAIGLISFCVVSIATAKNIVRYDLDRTPEHFEEFLRIYEKKYENPAELVKRFKIFEQTLQEINSLNEKSEHAVFGITEFADLTIEEFQQQRTCLRAHFEVSECTPQQSINTTTAAPDSFDWRKKGVVSSVKNQIIGSNDCGSCWAFSTIGNVESVNALKTGQLVELSEQQLIDCDTSDHGCNGGFPEMALGYLINQGSMTELDYPYEAVQGTCRYNADQANVKPSQCLSISVSEDELMERLYNTAPLSIAIDGQVLQRVYSTGVLTSDQCSGFKTNHAVLLVGYGTENGVPYWLVKNSWGENWGEGGYFKLQRGVNCLLMMQDAAHTAVM